MGPGNFATQNVTRIYRDQERNLSQVSLMADHVHGSTSVVITICLEMATAPHIVRQSTVIVIFKNSVSHIYLPCGICMHRIILKGVHSLSNTFYMP